MGQVLLLVGNGRLSRHLQRYFRLLGIPFRVWTRKSEQPFNRALRGCSHVLLAIRDDAIQTFVEEHSLQDKTVVHFSGSLHVQGAWGAHPLMTFAQKAYTFEEYQRIHFVLDSQAPPLGQLLPGLPNPWHRLSEEQKGLYHALCVLGGNYTQMLWQHVFTRLEEIGIPREAAYPYLRQVAGNLEQEDAPLTGPLVRGDQGTIARNVAALQGDAFQDVYLSFVKAYANR